MQQKARTAFYIALGALFILAPLMGDFSEAETYRAVHFYIDDGTGQYVDIVEHAPESAGYIIPPEKIPETPEQYDWFTAPRPAPGGYIDLDYIRADLTAPVPAMASFYAWDPAENGSRPTPPEDGGTAPSGEVTTVLAGIALACLTVGVATILWHKRE